MELRSIHVSVLSDSALDFAIAKAYNVKVSIDNSEPLFKVRVAHNGVPFNPSFSWDCTSNMLQKHLYAGGELLFDQVRGEFCAKKQVNGGLLVCYGETPLAALMRYVVASTLGETLTVPKILLS